jgi:hypothetical protein
MGSQPVLQVISSTSVIVLRPYNPSLPSDRNIAWHFVVAVQVPPVEGHFTGRDPSSDTVTAEAREAEKGEP